MHQFNPKTLTGFLKRLIKINEKLSDSGKYPISMDIIGNPGIGKSTIVEDVAKELGYHLIIENLSTIEYIGDLIGFTTKIFEMIDPITSSIIKVTEGEKSTYIGLGYKDTGVHYTKIISKEKFTNIPEKTILFIDDYRRGNISILNAIMELVNKQTLPGVIFPKHITIILASNPDDGINNNTASPDDAFNGRLIAGELMFDVECWAEWADANNLDEQGIDFVLMYPEIVTSKRKTLDDTETGGVQPRALARYFSALKHVPNKKEDFDFVTILGNCAVGEHITSLFCNFIKDSLEDFPNMASLFEKEGVKTLISACTTDRRSYVLVKRLEYYIINAKAKKINLDKKRIAELILSKAFTPDQIYYLLGRLEHLASLHTFLLNNPEIIKFITHNVSEPIEAQ